MSGLVPSLLRRSQTAVEHRTKIPFAACAAVALLSSSVSAAPAIRTSATNTVPGCASPERLMAFLVSRNPNVDPRYRDIARWYKYWGEAWRVRWDYAFFQMVIETNALKFRRPDGERGDVHEKQNNFAGIGATGGGVPGDRFPDIKTGVHAQIQHLVAYSGERLASPIAPRTEQQQDGIVAKSLRLQREVTFGDLARRWAADRAYSRTIDAVAEQFRTTQCNNTTADAAPRAVPVPQPATRKLLASFPPPYHLGGPKPAALAGPETLPWADPDVMVREYGDNTDTPIVRENDGTPVTAPPVRTIWSRDGVAPADDAPKVAPKRQPQQTTRVLQPSNAAPQQQPVIDAGTIAAEGDEPTLPHFKIAPEIPAPSRLGGPAVVAPMAPQDQNVRFKDIVHLPPAAAAPAAIPTNCQVLAASFGGKKTLLVRAKADGETRYTALTVIDGFEKSMFDIYAKSSAPGAEIIGEYPNKDQALADARANCAN